MLEAKTGHAERFPVIPAGAGPHVRGASLRLKCTSVVPLISGQ